MKYVIAIYNWNCCIKCLKTKNKINSDVRSNYGDYTKLISILVAKHIQSSPSRCFSVLMVKQMFWQLIKHVFLMHNHIDITDQI